MLTINQWVGLAILTIPAIQIIAFARSRGTATAAVAPRPGHPDDWD